MNQQQEQFDVSSIPFDFNPLAQHLDEGSSVKLYAGDDKLHVQFKVEAVLNPSKSTKAGRPVYDDVDMIVIRTPGSQLTSIVAPAKMYMDRFGAKYQAWKTTQAQAASGTPLDHAPFLMLKPSLVAELKYRNIYTVEQLAELPDSSKQSIMGGHELSRRAAEWISQSAEKAQDDEKEALKARLADMEAKLASLAPPVQAKIATPAAKVAVKE